MLAHQGLVENLVDFVIRAPVIAHDMVGYSFNKLRLQVIVTPFLLYVGVAISNQTLSVVNFHVRVVGSDHVQRKQVHNSFFPSLREGILQIIHCLSIVIFDAVQSCFVRHIALPHHVGHRLDLQEDQVRHVLGYNFQKVVQMFPIVRLQRHPVKSGHRVRRVVYSSQ